MWASGVRSATADQSMGGRLQSGDRFGAGSGAALRVRSRVPVADGAGGSELSHAGGFSRGEAERVGRAVHAGVGGAQQRGPDHAGTGDAGRHEDQSVGEHAELSTGRNDSGASGAGAAARGGDGRSTERRGQCESKASPGSCATRATTTAGERAGRVTEVAGAQIRRKSQE